MMVLLGILQLVACAFMCGLIWTIQCLHYPAFGEIAPQGFSDFHRRHSRVITYIVGPVMLLELITAILLCYSHVRDLFLQLNLALLVLTWLSTAFFVVPIHNQLAIAQDHQQISRLVLANWPRTLFWTLRLFLLCIWIIIPG